jgi:hypothetical protein
LKCSRRSSKPSFSLALRLRARADADGVKV